LGALLLETKQFAQAEKVYRDDLFFIPKNGWALNGLYHCLLGQRKAEEASKVKKQFDEA
jgi:hypothetical protein